MKITAPTNKLNPLTAGFDTTLAGFANSIVGGLGILGKTVGDRTVYEIPHEVINLATAKILFSKGVTVESFPTFIDTSVACPFSYEDEEGETVSHTWETWKGSNHTFMDNTTDKKVYLGSNAGSNEDLTIAELYEAGLEDSVIDTVTLRGLINNEE